MKTNTRYPISSSVSLIILSNHTNKHNTFCVWEQGYDRKNKTKQKILHSSICATKEIESIGLGGTSTIIGSRTSQYLKEINQTYNFS